MIWALNYFSGLGRVRAYFFGPGSGLFFRAGFGPELVGPFTTLCSEGARQCNSFKRVLNLSNLVIHMASKSAKCD